jgi:hypothetical protein
MQKDYEKDQVYDAFEGNQLHFVQLDYQLVLLVRHPLEKKMNYNQLKQQTKANRSF